MKKFLYALSAIGITAVTATNVVSCEKDNSFDTDPVVPLNDRSMDWDENAKDMPNFSYVPKNTNDGSTNARANDPTTILWDDKSKQFYSWEVFRNGREFPSGWVEMTSPDMKNWTQTKERISLGKEVIANDKSNYWAKNNATPFVMGGSVWLNKDPDNKLKKLGIKDAEIGDVLFVVSIPPCKVINARTGTYDETIEEDAGLAYFVSHGFGENFYQSGVLSQFCNNDGLSGFNEQKLKNPKEKDQSKVPNQNWRDPFLYENKNGDLSFSISAGGHLEFWAIKSFTPETPGAPIYREYGDPKGNGNDYERLEKDKTMNDINILKEKNVGLEVPNVLRISEDTWYISCALQGKAMGDLDPNNPLFPAQTSIWMTGKFDNNGDFIPGNMGVHEYGTEGYAQRVNDPYQQKIVSNNTVVTRSMPANWSYDTDIYSWFGGAYTTDTMNFTKNNLGQWSAMQSPLNAVNPFTNATYNIPLKDYDKKTGTAVFNFNHAKDIHGFDKNDPFQIEFNYGNFNFKTHPVKSNGLNVTETYQLDWQNQINTNMTKWNTSVSDDISEDDNIQIVWNKTTLEIYDVTKGWVAHFMLPQGTKFKGVNGNYSSLKSWDLDGKTITK